MLHVCTCYRYLDATQPVEDGLKLLERGLVPADCYWPGTETVIQDVSSAQTLKVQCHQMLALIHYLLTVCMYVHNAQCVPIVSTVLCSTACVHTANRPSICSYTHST